jgi:hypothetical protein
MRICQILNVKIVQFSLILPNNILITNIESRKIWSFLIIPPNKKWLLPAFCQKGS